MPRLLACPSSIFKLFLSQTSNTFDKRSLTSTVELVNGFYHKMAESHHTTGSTQRCSSIDFPQYNSHYYTGPPIPPIFNPSRFIHTGPPPFCSSTPIPYPPSLSAGHHQFYFDDRPRHYQRIDGHRTYTHSRRSSSSSSRCRPPVRPKLTVNRSVRDSHGRRYPSLTVMSYNILSQDLIIENGYLYNDGYWLDWEYRKIKLLNEFLNIKPDIMCLQEVNEVHYRDWFKVNLEKEGYKSLYIKRTGEHKDGCAMFYRTNVVRLIEHKPIEFQQNKGTLNRDNVGLIVKFQLKYGRPLLAHQRDFIVATTHILYNPKAGEVKIAQISYLLAEIYTAANTTGNHTLPCILCGDFNSLPNSYFMKFLLNGRLDYTHLSASVIAGYHRRSKSYRPIPVPLLPENMRIGLDCKYHSLESETLNDTNTAQSDVNIAQSDVNTAQSDVNIAQSDVNIAQSDVNIVQSDVNIAQSSITMVSDLSSIDNDVSSHSVTSCDRSIDSLPDSKRIKESSPYRSQAILTHPFYFISCYPKPRDGFVTPSVTTYHKSASETVDYILCTELGCNSTVGFHLLSRHVLPSFHTLQRLGPQPNEVLSSDHLYLLVELQLVDC